ncbi:MAG: DUF4149 domain-containing protein [Gammaproteobacteria bacterium]|nr:DUF4149 domain-containing protein [Gammaproteobacteria bacterium]MBT4462072.1 DUF4149 domain-containing protein [Gammaproteobacteria bacterium]MBT4655064.1 DUF4149 domain-containing protein [Gammaproteobacteria bacterium]MBT5116446.1 DUF4149 domain-containing protein [Gammaproteobacteria bacterium]MBT5761583.1 DUF4149 domain-containing protein [Gammaproteobacteria bacterium]
MSSDLILVLVSIWIGSIIFFSAIIAPTVFKVLDEKSAGLFLRAFFPKYYIFGLIIGGLCLMLIFLLNIALNTMLLALLLVMMALTVTSKLMIPVINAARDMGEEGVSRFKKLHTMSVMLNVLTLIIGLIFIIKV